jgi:hypothetical protein
MTAKATEAGQAPDHQPPCHEFASPEDAVEIGYEIGRTLRENGASKSQETMHLDSWSRDYQASPNLAFWQIGFRASYRGQPKPSSRWAYAG